MDQDLHTVSMIQMFSHPVFCVQDDIITESNFAAKQLSFEPGLNIQDLLETGRHEYGAFCQGALSLTLRAKNCSFVATVMRNSSSFVFHILSSTDAEETKSMALAAQCIREPLSGIMSICDKFTEKEYSHPQSASLTQNAYRILRILSNITDVATCKNRTYNMEIQNPVSILNEIAEKSVQLAKAANRSIIFESAEHKVYTRCDRDMLERAYYNLLSNAIKYSPENSSIHIAVKKAENRVQLCVKNACDHMLTDELGTIFSRYQRHPGIEDGTHGVGLGIPMVRAVAASHNGTLLLTQNSNMDVSFTLSIGITADHNTLRSTKCRIDYAGGRNHGLLELADVLPLDIYNM